MRIALICHVYPPEPAPAGHMVRELAEDLVAAGHAVTVVTGWPNHPRGVLYPGWRARFRALESDRAGFKVLRCGHSIRPRGSLLRRMWYYLTFAASTFINGLAMGRLDAVLCLSTPIFGSWSAWLLARFKKARFLYDIFDLHPESARNAGLIGEGLMYRALRAQDRLLCRLSDRIITLSEGMKRAIVERGIEANHVSVVPFWIDTERIRPGPPDNAWRRAHGIDPGAVVALYAGTIGYISGTEILVRAAERLRDRSDVLLLVVGEGVAKEAIRREAAEKGLTNIRFLPFQPADVLSEMLAASDMGLVSLLPRAGQSSVPSKVLGYLAAGRLVIASVDDDSETARMILQGQCGLVVRPQDPCALARGIEEMADHPELRVQLGCKARQFLSEHYDRTRCTSMYEAMLTDCTSGLRPVAFLRSPVDATRRHVEIGPAAVWDLESMARCHIACFPDQLASRMGTDFVARFYRCYIDDPMGIVFVCREEGTKRVVGQIAGGRQAIRQDFYAGPARFYCLRLLAKFLIDPLVRRTLVSALSSRLRRALRGRSGRGTQQGVQTPSSHAMLQVLCVLGSYWGSGLADELIRRFHAACAHTGHDAMELYVHADNHRARAFYRKFGWQAISEAPNGILLRRKLQPGDAAGRPADTDECELL